MQQQSDIIIVGGGLNGPALALALAGGGFSVTLIDALPLADLRGAAFDGRAYAIALASQRMMTALGLWPALADHAQPILDIVASDGRPGEGASPLFLHFDHHELEEGPMGYMIEDRFLRRALLQAVADHPGIKAINGRQVKAQEVAETGVTVTLDGGKRLSAGLLVGCDGRNSGTAKRAGISRVGHDYMQTALVAAIGHEKPHNGVAHQFFMPSGPLGILPLPGNVSSIVWAETRERAAYLSALDDAAFLAELRPAFGDFLGPLHLAGVRFSYDLKLSIAERFVAPRLALVGDAAHGLHPLAGQGLNLGFRDVAALAETLIMAKRRGEDFATPLVLQRYQQWRRFDTSTMAIATEGINRLFSNNNPILRLGRDLGLGAVNAMPGLRRSFMRTAAGLQGELPKLMHGREI